MHGGGGDWATQHAAATERDYNYSNNFLPDIQSVGHQEYQNLMTNRFHQSSLQKSSSRQTILVKMVPGGNSTEHGKKAFEY